MKITTKEVYTVVFTTDTLRHLCLFSGYWEKSRLHLFNVSYLPFQKAINFLLADLDMTDRFVCLQFPPLNQTVNRPLTDSQHLRRL